MDKSTYGQYIEERFGDLIVEGPGCFATYRYLEPHTVYIVDLFVDKALRKTGHAAKMADMIAEKAKERGCTQMLGSVSVNANNATDSIKVLIAYGMKLVSASPDIIYFSKDLR